MMGDNLIATRRWFVDQQQPGYWDKFFSHPIGRAVRRQRADTFIASDIGGSIQFADGSIMNIVKIKIGIN